MNWMKNVIGYLTGDTLRELKKKNQRLEEKLLEKQDHINKTNAYWKKKLYEKTNQKEPSY